MSTECRAAIRAALRAPLIPALVMLLSATGLGFALAMWSVLDALYFRALPIPAASRVVTILERHPERGRMGVTPANFLDWSRSVTAFSAVSGSFWIDVSVNGDRGAERLKAAKVLPGFFEVWGLSAVSGRLIAAADFEGDGRVAVVSQRVWRERLQELPDATGSVLRIDGVPHTVVGVMPEAASSIGHYEIWVPWILTAAERADRQFHLVSAIGRLRDGRTITDAAAELDAEYARLARDRPETTRDWRATVVPLRNVLLELPGTAVVSLSAVAALTFGLACLNVGALVAAWWSGRRQELLTRMAIGGSRLQVVRGLLVETTLWAGAGVAGAVPVALGCLAVVSAILTSPDSPFDFAPRLDTRAVAFGIGLFGVFVLGAALAPALRTASAASRLMADPRAVKRPGSRSGLAIQIAVALVVCTAAVALAQNARALTRLARPDSSRRQAVEVALPESRYATEAAQRDFFARLLMALGTRAEIASAAASSYVPPVQALGNVRFTIDGRSSASDAQSASPAAVSANAFRALGVSLIQGRLFDNRDGAGAPDVCVLSEALAHRYWPGADPIGQRLRIAGLARPVTVVGVVADVMQPLSTDPRAEAVLYLPFEQVPWPFMTMLLEPSGESAAVLTALREELARVDDAIASGPPRRLDDLQTEWLRSPRLHALAVAVFGGASLLLTLAGLFARVTHGVVRRRREWALRQAIGATPGQVWQTVAREVTGVTVAGVIAGLLVLPIAAAAGRHLVYGANLLDWQRALGVGAAIAVAALLAGVAPARHATRGDLATVLRDE